MSILVVNAGSSSVKFGLFDFDTLRPTARALLDWAGSCHQATLTITPSGQSAPSHRTELDAPDYRTAVTRAMQCLRRPDLATGNGREIRVVAVIKFKVLRYIH